VLPANARPIPWFSWAKGRSPNAHFSDVAKGFNLNNGPFTVLAGDYFQDEVTVRAGDIADDRTRKHWATLTYKDGVGATIGNPVDLSATAACLEISGK